MNETIPFKIKKAKYDQLSIFYLLNFELNGLITAVSQHNHRAGTAEQLIAHIAVIFQVRNIIFWYNRKITYDRKNTVQSISKQAYSFSLHTENFCPICSTQKVYQQLKGICCSKLRTISSVKRRWTVIYISPKGFS